MKKSFCDRCEKEKPQEDLKHDDAVVREYSKPDGSKGPQLRMLIELPFFVHNGDSPDFCKACFQEIVMELMAEGPAKPAESAVVSTEDIPF